MMTFDPKRVLAMCMKLGLAEAMQYGLGEYTQLRPFTGASFGYKPGSYWKTIYFPINKKNRHLCPGALYHNTDMDAGSSIMGLCLDIRHLRPGGSVAFVERSMLFFSGDKADSAKYAGGTRYRNTMLSIIVEAEKFIDVGGTIYIIARRADIARRYDICHDGIHQQDIWCRLSLSNVLQETRLC